MGAGESVFIAVTVLERNEFLLPEFDREVGVLCVCMCVHAYRCTHMGEYEYLSKECK